MSMKFIQTLTGTTVRECLYDDAHSWDLKSLRQAVAEGGYFEAIGLFTIVYDKFGREFESFVRRDQARRNRGEPTKPEPNMAPWCPHVGRGCRAL
jgi:hypothetical protein